MDKVGLKVVHKLFGNATKIIGGIYLSDVLLERWIKGDIEGDYAKEHYNKHVNTTGDLNIVKSNSKINFPNMSEEQYLRDAEELADTPVESLSPQMKNKKFIGYMESEKGNPLFVKLRKGNTTDRRKDPPIIIPTYNIVLYLRNEQGEPLIISYYTITDWEMNQRILSTNVSTLPKEETNPKTSLGKVYIQEEETIDGRVHIVEKEEDFDSYKEAKDFFHKNKHANRVEEIKWGKVTHSQTRQNVIPLPEKDNREFYYKKLRSMLSDRVSDDLIKTYLSSKGLQTLKDFDENRWKEIATIFEDGVKHNMSAEDIYVVLEEQLLEGRDTIDAWEYLWKYLNKIED